MSNKVLKPPLIEETMEDMENLKLEGGSEWETGSNLGPPGEGRRGSVGSGHLSVVSGESRRQSLFTEEDLRDDEESEGSKEDDEDEERKRIKDEVFVDKTRAAMVVIGTKDIKDALERQKAVEISRKTPEARFAHILFHQAKFLMSQSRFKEALLFINRALCTESDNKEWLTEKSRCYLYLLQPETALQHVDKVLQKDPNYFKALVLKGEILYSMWDLEKSMLYFVQGRRQRPENSECIRGIHKVKMALEEIADYRLSNDRIKKKSSKNRSKSAKGRLTSTPPTDCLLRRDQKHSLSSQQRPSTKMSRCSEDSSTIGTSRDVSPHSDLRRPTTAMQNRRRLESTSASRSQKSELKISTERPLSAKGKRGASNRPKTALNRRSRSKSTSQDLAIEDIRRFVKESMSGSYKSSTLRRFSESTQKSTDRSGYSSRSVSSSMEDISREDRHSDRSRLPKVKNKGYNSQPRQLSKITPGTKVSMFLGQDKMFLDSLLKDKDLKRSHTVYTKRALRIAREVQHFVSEREKYWKNRENFTRYTTTEEDTLI